MASGVAVMFATIDRPYCAQRLVRSIKRHAPAAKIYVADQSERSDAADHFYERNGVTVKWMPYDAGVTASRNALLDLIDEDYVVLCDDDFVFNDETDFQDALSHLDSSDTVDLIAGRLVDYWTGGSANRYWENFLSLDRENRVLFTIPIYAANPAPVSAGGVTVYRCDAVMNWFIARMSMFRSGLRWDEQFKSNGEHEDFFLNIKENTDFGVSYLPSMVCDHKPPQTRGYEKLRSRSAGWRLFMEKWGIDQMVEIGRHCRTIVEPGRDWAYEGGPAKFFTSAPLKRDREWPSATVSVDVMAGGGLLPRNRFSADGERAPLAPVSEGTGMIGGVTIKGYRVSPAPKVPAASELVEASTMIGQLFAGYMNANPDDETDIVVWLWNPSSESVIHFDTAWIYDGQFAGYGTLKQKAKLHPATWTAVHVDAPPALGKRPSTMTLIISSPELGSITISSPSGEERMIGLRYRRIALSPAMETNLNSTGDLAVDFDGIHVLRDIAVPSTVFLREREGTEPADMATLPPVRKGDILSLPHYRVPSGTLTARVHARP